MGKNNPSERTQLSMLHASLLHAKAAIAAGNTGLMFFLLRMAFWLGLVLILLPSGGAQRSPSTNEVGPGQALSAATDTVHDLRGFCAREPNACTVGAELGTTIAYRARAGAKMVYDLLTEALAPQETGSVAGNTGRSEPAKPSLRQASQNTLTPADLEPVWRGPPPHKTAGHPA
jgi:hypothetical protein